MPFLTPKAVAAAIAIALFGQIAAADSVQPKVEHISTFVWHEPDEDFGGFSGLEIGAGGTSLITISDRATIRWGNVIRDDQGRIREIDMLGHTRLRDQTGAPLHQDWRGDSEGLALDSQGRIWISFETDTRVVRYDTPDSAANILPSPPEFAEFQRNASLEALAIDADDTIYTIPERSGGAALPFPVWRYRDGAWDQPFEIGRNGDWLVTGADIGPDGRLYLLERDFRGLLGFRSRIRRFDVGSDSLNNEVTLLSSRALQYDNLESISVWDDGVGIRLTMISDDNFNFLQRTEIVEHRVTEPAP